MKKLIFLTTLFVTLAAMAQEQSEYDQNAPFGFCTVSSRTNASSTYDITGGGCYTYPVPASLADKTIVLTADGTNDMKGAIQNAIKRYDIVVLDGSNGDFIISSSIGFERGNKTLLGINNARLCTQWYVTDEIKAALDAAGVPNMSTSGGGGTLSNGKNVSVDATNKTAEGNTYVWTGYYKTTAAGQFEVTAYSLKDGAWKTCADGKSDVYVSSKTNTKTTALESLRASDGLISFIGDKEGFVSSITYDTLAYNVPTIGHGYVVSSGEAFYNNLTRTEAFALLVEKVNHEVFTSRVNEMLLSNNTRFNQQQFDALVSFSYNLGTGWTYSSDLKNILMNSYGTVTSSDTKMIGVVTSSDGLNLRKEPTTSSDALTVMPYGSTVTLVSTTKYNTVWYKVTTSSGLTGYCSSTYLNVSSSGGSTTGRDLNYVNKNALIKEMLAYHHAGGNCYYGLLYRRVDELEMFLYGDYTSDGRSNKHSFPSPYCLSF